MKNSQTTNNYLSGKDLTTAYSKEQYNSVVEALKSIFCKENKNLSETFFKLRVEF